MSSPNMYYCVECNVETNLKAEYNCEYDFVSVDCYTCDSRIVSYSKTQYFELRETQPNMQELLKIKSQIDNSPRIIAKRNAIERSNALNALNAEYNNHPPADNTDSSRNLTYATYALALAIGCLAVSICRIKRV